MTKPHRQKYGLGSIIKKAVKGVKKIVKSPIGKAALIGGGLWGLNRFGIPGTGGVGQNWWSKALGTGPGKFLMGVPRGSPSQPGKSGILGGALNWIKKNPGQAGLLGLGAAGTILPFMAKGPDEEEEGESWSVTPSSIADIRLMARNQDPSLAFMPNQNYVQSGYYLKDGGVARLANGGGPANAQAEQMLRMHYQKYRNQGGRMSYQQFKMMVLQQAQQQGPMAQSQMAAKGGRMGYANGEEVLMASSDMGDPQENADAHAWRLFGKPYKDLLPEELELLDLEMDRLNSKFMAKGGRADYQGGELVTDESMMAATPTGMMEENLEEVQGEPTREQLEAIALEIFQLPLEQLDEEQLMLVYQTAMQQQPREEMMQEEGVQYAAKGGIMDLGGMEKDYRNTGGFVEIGGKEKADDVPARLSKNEFVFTADAVRNAGGGDIDQGAAVMQNMMKNLEAGGEISPESQGAQGMYNNMKQLQTRMI